MRRLPFDTVPCVRWEGTSPFLRGFKHALLALYRRPLRSVRGRFPRFRAG